MPVKTKPLKIGAQLFLLVLLGDALSIILGFTTLHIALKIMLMPILLAMTWQAYGKTKEGSLGLLSKGLFFAWAGDIFLLFDKSAPVFFLLGLGSFLLTHVFYILMFLKINRKKANKQSFGTIAGTIAIVAYGIILVKTLWPFLNGLEAPVLVYALCICSMAVLALQTPAYYSKVTRALLICGALLFVVSDSILAVNKFMTAGAWAPPSIMLTYGLAQLAIVAGVSNRPASTYGEALAPGV